MAEPYVVLKERYCPKQWRAWRIGRYLTSLTAEMGLTPLDDPIHGPQSFRAWCDRGLHAEAGWVTYSGGQGRDWHQDGDTKPGSRMDNAMVLWSNRTPTEFKYKGRVYQPKPFQVIIARNLACHHRRPANAPGRRWLFRQRVEIPQHLQLP